VFNPANPWNAVSGIKLILFSFKSLKINGDAMVLQFLATQASPLEIL